ncbi:MAG: hypothetical protein NC452_05255 [Eubacterium sp.]|nr:hypothetical protein [Eubacterium sp.]
MTNFDDFKLAVEALSGGNNTVLLDDLGMPSVVVPFPKLKYSDVIEGGTQETLPAFIVEGQEKEVIYVSKFLNVIVNDRAYSLPMKDPAASLNFDRALTVCRNKGAGWHLNTNALWAAIALWCKKNGTMPHGNNSYGADSAHPHERAVPSSPLDTSGRVCRTAAGSGPATWCHNYDTSGIADLNGNVWEWTGGLRLVDGEIQIIPYGNAMKHDCNMSATSTEWKAIKADGTLVSPGAADTLKFDWAGNKITLAKEVTTRADALRSTNYEALALASGVIAPPLLAALGLFPNETGYEGDNVWINNSGERLPLRGGDWHHGAGTGVFALNLSNPRSVVDGSIGFRSAFCE